jgi:hypothetical protein
LAGQHKFTKESKLPAEKTALGQPDCIKFLKKSKRLAGKAALGRSNSKKVEKNLNFQLERLY